MKQFTYKAKTMFQGEAHYVEIRQGRKWHDWLKVGAVPQELRYLLIPGKVDLEPAQCQTKELATVLAARMNEREEAVR